MKFYYSIIALIAVSLTGCSGSGKNDKAAKTDSLKFNTIDFKGNNLESLQTSPLLRDQLCQDWEHEDDAKDAESADPTSDMEMQYRGYCFFKDGTVVKDPRSSLKIGKWILNEGKPSNVDITFNDGEKENIVLGKVSPNWMTIAGRKGGNPPEIYVARAFRHNNLKDDPFYPDNLWWMIKPAQPETDEQIKKRFIACMHFFVLFFNENAAVHPKRVSFVGLPCCFNWYVGGIILQRKYKIKKIWINCFYNEEQAMVAYKLAEKLVSKKFDWGKDEGRWMKRSLGVLKQMEKRLDSIPISN